MERGQLEGDEDSLFGSPPSSPIRGRSPSPGLALPSPNRGSVIQNVGTIALPGSHHSSELAINPLALSLSHPLRPPAATNLPAPPLSHVHSPKTSCRPSRRSSAGPSKTKRIRKKMKTVTPRPDPPAIPLPDPSEPPPTNFLRNQSLLLGTAGLIAGIKPAKLSTNIQTRGVNVANPIVIDDRNPSFRPRPRLRPRSRSRSRPHLPERNQLPSPSLQEIMAVLVAQKDTTPVLQSFLKLSNLKLNTSPDISSFGSAGFRRITFQGTLPQAQGIQNEIPPPKRRKLNRVPAGAVDWDVPFPFAQGEGPDEYRRNWERDRLKQLWFQLVQLIKDATKIAAAKAARRKEGNTSTSNVRIDPGSTPEPKVNGHYRQSTMMINGSKPPASVQAFHEFSPCSPLKPAGSGRESRPTDPFGPVLPPTSSQSPMSPPLPAILTPSPPMQCSVNGAPSPDASLSGIDQELFDSWMEIFKLLPASPSLVSDVSSRPSTMSTEADFGFLDIDPCFNFDASTPNSDFSSEIFESCQDTNTTADEGPSNSQAHDAVIDPQLLALSTHPSNVAPSSSCNDLPFMSSSADFDLTTLNFTATREPTLPDVVPHVRSEVLDADINDSFIPLTPRDIHLPHVEEAPEKRVTNFPDFTPTLHRDPNASESTMMPTCIPEDTVVNSGSSTDLSTGSSHVQPRPLNKAEVLKRAGERKKLLEEELERVKRQLWETTIEQGVLVHMNKHFTNTA